MDGSGAYAKNHPKLFFNATLMKVPMVAGSFPKLLCAVHRVGAAPHPGWHSSKAEIRPGQIFSRGSVTRTSKKKIASTSLELEIRFNCNRPPPLSKKGDLFFFEKSWQNLTFQRRAHHHGLTPTQKCGGREMTLYYFCD